MPNCAKRIMTYATEAYDELRIPLPRLAGQKRDQASRNLLYRSLDVPFVTGSQHRTNIGGGLRHRHLRREVAFEQGAGDAPLLLLHVAKECLDDTLRIDVWISQRDRDVEQVATFAALVKRPQLGAQQFVKLIRGNIRGSREPTR